MCPHSSSLPRHHTLLTLTHTLNPTLTSNLTPPPQDIYNDAACSAVYGRPLFHNSFSPHKIRQRELYLKDFDKYMELCGQWERVEVRGLGACGGGRWRAHRR